MTPMQGLSCLLIIAGIIVLGLMEKLEHAPEPEEDGEGPESAR